jgi:hypothetical protein
MRRKARIGRLSSTRKLLSAAWAADVEVIERAISRVEDAQGLASDCAVAFFEIADDEKLHVNVTHRRLTARVRGWAGPADTPDGFVHNRTFGTSSTTLIVHQLRAMVFARPA